MGQQMLATVGGRVVGALAKVRVPPKCEGLSVEATAEPISLDIRVNPHIAIADPHPLFHTIAHVARNRAAAALSMADFRFEITSNDTTFGADCRCSVSSALNPGVCVS